MKKHILLLAIALGVTTFAAAQDSKEKKTYQPDPAKIVDLSGIKISLGQLNDFLIVTYNPSFESSDKLTGAQIQGLKTNHKAVADSIQVRFNKFISKDQAKFTADTTALYHPAKK